MVFSSIPFLFTYLPLVLVIYYVTPLRLRNLFLLAANLIFYGWGEPRYISIMVLATLIGYAHGILIEKHRSRDRLARGLVLSSVAVSLGLLVFFKYYDFIAVNLALIPGLGFIKPLNLPLPVGISFYIFQIISYTVDVYRQAAPVQKNAVRFGTYVSLFPQLVAGPIVRYNDVAEQLAGRKHSVSKFASGVRRFSLGLFKKVLLANNIGALWNVFRDTNPSELSAAGAWLGIIAFAFQIYFDFSGYSDMAIGLGRMIGFEFLENFNYPYISKSITEFWRRWHISLGIWFREYVYIPLGGNRRGILKQFRNILIVWLLTGIWHGASWNFLLWGLYYAVLLVAEKAFLLKWLEKAPKAVAHLYTMLFVLIGWALFAMEDFSACLAYLSAMFGLNGAGFSLGGTVYYLKSYLALLAVLFFAATPFFRRLYERAPEKLKSVAVPIFVLLTLILSTAYLVDSTYNPFLYFRF